MRVPAEDIKQVETVIDGRKYRARNGFFEMPTGDAKIHLRSGDYGASWNAAGVVNPSVGFHCQPCNRGSYFIRCGKCGGPCEKEST